MRPPRLAALLTAAGVTATAMLAAALPAQAALAPVTNAGAAASVGSCVAVPTYDSTPTTSDCPSGYGGIALNTSRNVAAVWCGAGWECRKQNYGGDYTYWTPGPKWLDTPDYTRKIWSRQIAAPTPTPTPTPTQAPDTTVTTSNVTSTTVTVNWTAVAGATGYYVERDGQDSTGGGPWGIEDPATARSRVFDKLIPGGTYTFSVTPRPGGVKKSVTVTLPGGTTSPSPTATPSETTSPTPTPTTTAPVDPTDSTPGWLSGAASLYAGNGTFGTWRGSPVEIGGTWLNDTAAYTLRPASACGGCNGEWTNFDGAMDIAVNPPSFPGWAATAGGASDQFFTDMAKQISSARAGKGISYVRPWHEWNGNWVSWRPQSDADYANFKIAHDRIYDIVRANCANCRVTLGTAASTGSSVARAYPSKVDVLSIDFYNNYPFCTTSACFADKIENGAGENSLADLQRLAASKGDPIMISEWSNQGAVRTASQGGGGESPQFIRDWNAWLRANAGDGPGEVIAEVQFNLWNDQFSFYDTAAFGPNGTTTLQPQTATEYRRLW